MLEKTLFFCYNTGVNYIDIAKDKFEKLKTKKQVIILSIESSCDETSVAIVKNGREVLSNIIASQIEIHRRFGGVVPEVASRNHITAISNIFEEALKEANVKKDDLDAIAVTYGAGLMGALLVGVNFAKALAYSLSLPLIAVSHVFGHIAANYISHKDLVPPFSCLMVSGGHSAILQVDDYCKFHLVGSTVDDAVGECFDKVARVLGLPYPGGPEIDKLAKSGKNEYNFTVSNSLKHTYNFSFSGIKTAGKTRYAYPGCPEGRGFDEMGEKGIIFGEVSKGWADMKFIPLSGRQYRIFEMDLTGETDATLAVMQKFSGDEYKNDIVRIVFNGIFSGRLDFKTLGDIK